MIIMVVVNAQVAAAVKVDRRVHVVDYALPVQDSPVSSSADGLRRSAHTQRGRINAGALMSHPQ